VAPPAKVAAVKLVRSLAEQIATRLVKGIVERYVLCLPVVVPVYMLVRGNHRK
jgi:hypothetical protein